MDCPAFLDWLIRNKKMSQRSAKDVLSRCKRVCRIINEESITKSSIEKLASSKEFNAKSTFIKSQLRRSIILFCEYEESLND